MKEQGKSNAEILDLYYSSVSFNWQKMAVQIYQTSFLFDPLPIGNLAEFPSTEIESQNEATSYDADCVYTPSAGCWKLIAKFSSNITEVDFQ